MSQGKGLHTSTSGSASDRGVDVALAGLSRAVSRRVPDEDEAFARAVIQRVSEAESVDPIDPADLDELLDAPLPDDFDAASRGPVAEVGPAIPTRDDRATSGRSAAAREPAMSTKQDPPPPSLRDPIASRPSPIDEGLARLSMSGPPSVSRPADDDRFGADSGLINLKALNDPESEAQKDASFAAAAAPASTPVTAPSLGGDPPASKRAAAATAPTSKRAAPVVAVAPVTTPKPATGASKTAPAEAPVARSSRAPVAAPAPIAAATATKEPKKKTGMLIVGTFGGVALMAAAAFVYVGAAHKDGNPTSAVAAKNEAVSKVAIAQAAPSEASRAATTIASAAPSSADDVPIAKQDGKDSDERREALEAPAASASVVSGGVVATRAGDAPAMIPSKPGAKSKAAPVSDGEKDKVAAADAPATPPPTVATPTAAPSPQASAETGKTASKSGSLDDMLGLGAGGTAPPKATAAPAGPDLADRPDRTDLQSAINAKLGRAAGCVKGLDGPTKVSVNFGPDGSVTGVSVVSGPAKGTGAEACISTAFRSAKVPATKKGGSGTATLMP